MKIALLHATTESPLYRSYKENVNAPPLGLGSIAAHLELHGRNVDLFSLKIFNEDNAGLTREFALEAYDILGFTVYTQNFRRIMSMVNYLKQQKPSLTIVLGGAHASACHREIIRDFKDVDIVVRGEGEEIFQSIVDCLATGGSLEGIHGITFRESRGIVETPPGRLPAPLDHLAHPAREFRGLEKPFIDRYDYRRMRIARASALITSRGCPYNCSFCAIPGTACGEWRAHSARYVAEEAGNLKVTRGIEHFFIVDANFFMDPERAIEIARALSRLECSFSFATRVDQIIKAGGMLSTLSSLGCDMIELGIESGSESLLRAYRKGVTVSQNEEALRLLRREMIRLGFDFIMFMPSMTWNELRENLAFLKRNELFGVEPSEILMKRVNLYPGTALRESWEAHEGRQADPHSLPDYGFEDRRVQQVYSQAKEFFDYFCLEVKRKVVDVRKAAFSLEGLVAGGSSGISGSEKRLLNTIVLECSMMNRIPFLYFERLMDDAENQGAARAEGIPGGPWGGRMERFINQTRSWIDSISDIEASIKKSR